LCLGPFFLFSMKKVVILCQTGPGGKRRLAEEALRLAAGLTATRRIRLDLILTRSAIALLDPEMGGPIGTWESMISPHTRILVSAGTLTSPPTFVTVLPEKEIEKTSASADLVIGF
jgi:hypothetical protein